MGIEGFNLVPDEKVEPEKENQEAEVASQEVDLFEELLEKGDDRTEEENETLAELWKKFDSMPPENLDVD